MQFTITLALISTMDAASIGSVSNNQSLANATSNNEVPDWLIILNDFMELEDDSEFDLAGFLDGLNDDEINDLSALLLLMEDDLVEFQIPDKIFEENLNSQEN